MIIDYGTPETRGVQKDYEEIDHIRILDIGLVPVQYRECEYGLLIKYYRIPVLSRIVFFK